ncbi:MAG: hypothetical protein ACREP9_16560, partial [Candidatus Dormibacteraceae bacterium]
VMDYLALGAARRISFPYSHLIVIDLTNRRRQTRAGRSWDAVDMFTAPMYELASLQLNAYRADHPDVTILHVRPQLPAIRVGDFRFTSELFQSGRRFGAHVMETYFDLDRRLFAAGTIEICEHESGVPKQPSMEDTGTFVCQTSEV